MLELRNAEKKMKRQKKTRKTWTLQHAPWHHLKQAQKNKHSVDSQLQSQLTDLVLTQKINEQWLTLWFSSRHRQSSQQCIKHTQWGSLLFLLNFWANTFTVCDAAFHSTFYFWRRSHSDLWLSEIQARKFSITSFPIHCSVPCSRTSALHFRGWGGGHAHTHSLHWDGHAATRGRRAGVERISEV